MISDTRSFGWLIFTSCNAPAMPNLAATIEMSWVVPGSRPVSDMYWTIVIGPNHSRCRGRFGLSFEPINGGAAAVWSGDRGRPAAAGGEVGAIAARRVAGVLNVSQSGSRQTPTT